MRKKIVIENSNYIACLFVSQTAHSESFHYLKCILEKKPQKLQKIV